ncbi:hypothetical protein QR680_011240 [Steinernema hermaphroditum]|uniref:Aromatic-L-amino-acid decarboxylase n=1 Tax=Steinernema hermaphroditum TaxID=289476 RepID=A0AA39IU29_9BILA|nr:hypothetical protein QR680_011240 [Steinernema hermaphroditum]
MRKPTLSGIVITVGVAAASLLVGFLFSQHIAAVLKLNKAEVKSMAIVYEPSVRSDLVLFIENYVVYKAPKHGVKVKKVDLIEVSDVCEGPVLAGRKELTLQITNNVPRCNYDVNVIQMVVSDHWNVEIKVLMTNATMRFEATGENEVRNTLLHILTTHPNMQASLLPKALFSKIFNHTKTLLNSRLVQVLILVVVAVVVVEYFYFGRKRSNPEDQQVLRCMEDFEDRLKHIRKEQQLAVSGQDLVGAPPSYGVVTRRPKKFDCQMPVSSADFTKYMSETVDFVVDYLENSDQYPVTTDKRPGFLTDTLPKEAPHHSESFGTIMDDVRRLILPGLTHWQHKRFHAYFPAGSSFPDIIADTIVAALGVVGFTWDACPALAEMEMQMVNWLGRALGLPEAFLFGKNTNGGGSIQPSASDCIYLAVMASRYNKLKKLMETDKVKEMKGDEKEKKALLLGRLVAYSSPEAHSSFKKACNMAMVRMHTVESDENFSLRGDALEKQIEKDIKAGYISFHVHATLGTTGICSFDNLKELGKVAKKHNMWFHVDAAYAGSAMICPEYRFFAKGIEMADSFNVNTHKFLLQSTTHSYIWAKDKDATKEAFKMTASYYQHSHSDDRDPRDWGIALSRRFQGIRLWFLFRMYGIDGMRAFIRRIVGHAATFERLIRSDDRLEIVGKRELGLVCFKIKNPDQGVEAELTEGLVTFINNSHKMLVTHSEVKGIHVCRICINHERSTESDILESWELLQSLINDYFASNEAKAHNGTLKRRVTRVTKKTPGKCHFSCGSTIKGDN